MHVKKPIDIRDELRLLKDGISRLETALHDFGYHMSCPSKIIDVQRILEKEPALRSAVKKTVPLRKRGGKMVTVSLLAIRVTDRLSPAPLKNEILLEALRLLPEMLPEKQPDLFTHDGHCTVEHRKRLKAFWTPLMREKARQAALRRMAKK